MQQNTVDEYGMVVTQYFCIVNLAASVNPELCVYVCVCGGGGEGGGAKYC